MIMIIIIIFVICFQCSLFLSNLVGVFTLNSILIIIIECNKVLIEKNSKIGRTFFHLFAKKGRLVLVKFFVEQDSDMKISDKYGLFHLHLAD